MLDRRELHAFITDLAARRDLWAHLVRHEPDQRTYEELVLREDVGIWLICWMDDHDTGFHDHDVSHGAVAVVRGRLREERLALGGNRSRIYSAGETFSFAADDIHRMSHPGGEPAVSLHAYSPPLARMGSYTIEPDGVVRRVSIPYAEELRPLGTAA
jgi:predicted metal-dependent enzyme (double-stranded beta helix superfamily)